MSRSTAVRSRSRLRVGKHVVNRSEQRLRSVSLDLAGRACSTHGPIEEPASRLGIAPPGHVDVDDLAVLVHGSVDVPPPAADLE
jgi:hypothetical protein